MTRTTFASTLVSLAALLALGGCNSGGLTATGSVIVTDTAGTTTGFQFPNSIRLDGAAGTTTGLCQISRGSSGVDGIVVDLYGDAQGLGHSVRSFNLMAHSDSPATGQITADLGGDEFSGTCNVQATSIDEGNGHVTLQTQACTLTHGTDTASVNVDLTFAGCTVI